jgi:hypothetical protein
MIVITKKIELSINPHDATLCIGCDFLDLEAYHDGRCSLYCHRLRKYRRCVRCLNDFGEGENGE